MRAAPTSERPIATTSALIYLRISANRTSEHASIEQQRADCTALAAQLGYTRTIEFVDEAVSAYQDRARPAYQQLLRQLEGSDAGTVIVWHLDRLYRKPRELEQLLDLLDLRPIRVESMQGGSFDLNRHEGRLFARQLVAFANYESAHKGARVARAQQHRATRGLLHGGRQYGYLSDGSLHPDEGTVLRRIVDAYLSGASETEIARRLNSSQIPTPGRSIKWHASTVQSILHSDRLHRHRSVRFGGVAIGTWQPLMTDDESALLRALQMLPQRRTTNSSRSLLGGLAQCAICGRRLVVQYSGRLRRYVCLSRDGGCGNGIAADALDRLVRAFVSTRAPFRRPTIPVQDLANAASELQRQVAENARAFGSGELPHDIFLARSDDLGRSADRLSNAAVAQTPTCDRTRWHQLPLPEQRRLLQQHMIDIWIEPSRERGRFDASRLRIRWRPSAT